jgi:hypothetical protein
MSAALEPPTAFPTALLVGIAGMFALIWIRSAPEQEDGNGQGVAARRV